MRLGWPDIRAEFQSVRQEATHLCRRWAPVLSQQAALGMAFPGMMPKGPWRMAGSCLSELLESIYKLDFRHQGCLIGVSDTNECGLANGL